MDSRDYSIWRMRFKVRLLSLSMIPLRHFNRRYENTGLWTMDTTSIENTGRLARTYSSDEKALCDVFVL